MQRLLALAILNSRKTPIEKYQYLSVLRTTNVHLFYRLITENIKVGWQPMDESGSLADKAKGHHASHLHTYRRRGMPAMVGALHTARG
jgi:hypothetical protein